ncbi:hypothetical protein PLICRDRAFT_176930 [Plicaturopsis crispa FD-325 SS-3]|nr:hypothetical protein PLICRDRAFT_176930 [Plicaturopsis crispa FD-325 SS-3]
MDDLNQETVAISDQCSTTPATDVDSRYASIVDSIHHPIQETLKPWAMERMQSSRYYFLPNGVNGKSFPNEMKDAIMRLLPRRDLASFMSTCVGAARDGAPYLYDTIMVADKQALKCFRTILDQRSSFVHYASLVRELRFSYTPRTDVVFCSVLFCDVLRVTHDLRKLSIDVEPHGAEELSTMLQLFRVLVPPRLVPAEGAYLPKLHSLAISRGCGLLNLVDSANLTAVRVGPFSHKEFLGMAIPFLSSHDSTSYATDISCIIPDFVQPRSFISGVMNHFPYMIHLTVDQHMLDPDKILETLTDIPRSPPPLKTITCNACTRLLFHLPSLDIADERILALMRAITTIGKLYPTLERVTFGKITWYWSSDQERWILDSGLSSLRRINGDN